ncbi:MAG: hypothetical protein ACOYVK_01615 [Bacillota bacterium]
MDRKEQIKEILYYVDNHRDSHKSRIVAANILGETERMTLDDEIIRELKVKLPTTNQREIVMLHQMIQ